MGTANSRTVSAALEQPLFDFIEDYRWKNRKKRSEVIVEAVENWAIQRGYDGEIDDEMPEVIGGEIGRIAKSALYGKAPIDGGD